MKKFLVTALCALLISGCATESNQTKGALLGTGFGAAIGAGLGKVIGGDSKSTAIGAGIGATLGAGAGLTWGKYLDNQEAQLREQFAASENVQIQRDQEQLNLTFKADMMFDSGSAAIKPGAKNEIERTAKVLTQYPETIIIVRGHTDSVGSEESNQRLSEKRAESVKNILSSQGVSAERILTIGYGEMEPVANNGTAAGRQANRRVEISIAPPEMFEEES